MKGKIMLIASDSSKHVKVGEGDRGGDRGGGGDMGVGWDQHFVGPQIAEQAQAWMLQISWNFEVPAGLNKV